MEYIEDYLVIQKTRFGDRFQYSVEIDEKCRPVVIPKLLLQPLIENSLKYGFRKKASISVWIRGWISGNYLVLEVKDDGTGFDISEERAKQAFTTSGLRDDLKHFGLGMYISELYCKKHDGFLTVENQSGGACVRAYFRSIVPESVVPETEAF